MKLQIRAYAASDIGSRQNNEDAFLINEDIGLFIVADGMGGHDKGEIASWFTSENLEKIVKSVEQSSIDETLDSAFPTPSAKMDSGQVLEYAVFSINRRLYELNQQKASECYPTLEGVDPAIAARVAASHRMGTTLVSLLIHEGHGYITNIGDSRVYRIASNGIRRLTQDHSWVEERLREGVLSPEEAKNHAKRNVLTRSVGFKAEVKADIDVLTLQPPERFLLCSDGLSNVVKEEYLLEICKIPDLRKACEKLIDEAKDHDAKDNITALLVDVAKDTGDEARKTPPDWTDI